MKYSQQGFIGVALAVVIVLVIGGGVYYQQKQKEAVKAKVQTDAIVDVQKDNRTINQDPKPVAEKTPVALSFEAKARAVAQSNECTKYGTIGAAIKVEQSNEYATFAINNGGKQVGFCAVDMYKQITADAYVSTSCKEGQTDCHATGLILSPRKVYESIPTAPDPSTFQ